VSLTVDSKIFRIYLHIDLNDIFINQNENIFDIADLNAPVFHCGPPAQPLDGFRETGPHDDFVSKYV
jgi:hypothetical protein